jgi:hypothetical protein
MTQEDKPFINFNSAQRLTNAAIKDELVYQLSSTCPYEVVMDDNRLTPYIRFRAKYYEQAEFILYRINTWNPKTPPVFIINTSDLTKKLQKELEQLQKSDSIGFDKLVTEAVQSLLESVNQRYYHINGIAYKVTWRFES